MIMRVGLVEVKLSIVEPICNLRLRRSGFSANLSRYSQCATVAAGHQVVLSIHYPSIYGNFGDEMSYAHSTSSLDFQLQIGDNAVAQKLGDG